MGRPKATYGRKGAIRQPFHADCFESSSSPANLPEVGSVASPQLPSPRIKKHKARIISCASNESSETSDETGQDVQDSKIEGARGRRALQVRDANEVVGQRRLRSKPQQTLSGRQKPMIALEPFKTSERAEFVTTNGPFISSQEHDEPQLGYLPTTDVAHDIGQSLKSEKSADTPKEAAALHSDEYARHAAPLLSLSSDSNLLPFTGYAKSLSAHFRITKLAEASYGEVYRLSLLPSTTTQLRSNFSRTDESVLKLIALKPPATPPSSSKITIDGKQRRRKQWTKNEQTRIESMSRIEDVTSEVRLLKHMSCVPGFTNFRALAILKGSMPEPFSFAWHEYNDNTKESEFPDPLSPGAYFGDDQLWAIIEMQDAGRDLEAIIMKSVWSVWDAFWGIAIAMAKGEEWARYEHRDLHLGNVCVKWNETDTTDPDDINAPPANLNRRLGFTGLETTIIDYTLSRADMSPRPAVSALDSQPKDDVAFLDLSLDPSLFQGDATVEYQYEIYRCMRSAALFHDPLASQPETKVSKNPRAKNAPKNGTPNGTDIWRRSHPLTNLVWLHFVLFKLCEGVEDWPSSNNRLYDSRPTQKHATALEEKISLLCSILELEKLNRGANGDPNGLASCTDLVAWAVQQGWLAEDDVIACGLGKDEDEESLLELVESLTVGGDGGEMVSSHGEEIKPKERRRRAGETSKMAETESRRTRNL